MQQIDAALRGATFTPGSLAAHTRKRIGDGQWADGTSEAEYSADVAAALADTSAGLVIYERRGGALAAVLALNPVPPNRRGFAAQPLLFVVYSADRDTIVTGYQTEGLDRLAIPARHIWLRPPPPSGSASSSS